MKNHNLRIIFSAIIIVLDALFLFLFRTVPVHKIWNGYTVVYVENSVPESTVISVLEDAGCGEIISLGAQKIPISSYLSSGELNSFFNTYLEGRTGYFSDYSKAFSLYYVPDNNDFNVARNIKRLASDTGVKAGLNAGRQYPFLAVIICGVTFLVLFFLSENKIPFLLASSFVILFVFSKPFYAVSCSAVLYMFAFYLSLKLWGRKDVLAALFRNPYVIIPLLFSFITACFCGWQEAFLFALTFASSLSALFFLKLREDSLLASEPFQITKIFSAKQISLVHGEIALHFFLCCLPLVAILLSFVFTTVFSPSLDSEILLPMPLKVRDNSEPAVRETDSAGQAYNYLPSLDDFYEWAWNIKAFPYRNLNTETFYTEVEEGDTITIPEFVERDGRVFEEDSEVLKFDDDFRSEIDKEIEELGYGAIEKLMEKQGTDIKISYSFTSGEVTSNMRSASLQPDMFTLRVILFCLLAPVALLLLYAIKSKAWLPIRFKAQPVYRK